MNNPENYNLLELLLDNTEESFVLLDVNLHIKAFNKKASELALLFFKKALSQDESVLTLVRSESLAEMTDIYSRVLQGETVRHSVNFATIDHAEVTLENTSKPVRDSAGSIIGLITLTTDVTETEKARQLLEQNEKRFRALVQEGADITGIMDDKANYLYVSPGCENLLGFSSDDFIGKSAFDFIHDSDRERVLESFSEIFTKKRIDIQPFRFLHKNGSWRWLETVATNMLNDPFINGVIVNSRDITERLAIQNDIERKEEQLSLIYNTVSDVIFMLQVEENEEYKFLTVNDAFYRTTGLKKENVILKYVRDIIPAHSLNTVLDKYKTAKETRDFVSWEETSDYPEGKKTGIVTVKGVFNENRECVLLIGSVHDITNERKIQEQVNLLESVVKNTTDMVMITSADPVSYPGPYIQFVNDAFTEITGYLPSEAIGKTPRLLHGKNTDRKELAKLSACLQSFENCEIEVINYKKNGEEFWNNISIFPIEGKEGTYMHFVAFQRDVTERKKQEIEKEQLINELTKSNQELKQFSYITSHNLRGPLTNLLAISSFIDTKNIQDEFTVTLIEGFKSSTFKLNQTLEDLINILMIKETSQQFRQVNLVGVYSGVLKSVSELIKTSGVRINIDFSQAEKIKFNEVYMESIFMNLITNAIKYHHPDRKPVLSIYTKISNNSIQLIFEDNGLGLNLEKIKDRLFGLYQRFHTHTEGQGLGLYLVSSQVKAAGGSIAVESTENVGSKFVLTFKND